MKRFNELWERLLESPTKFDFVLTCNSGRSRYFAPWITILSLIEGVYLKFPKYSDTHRICCNHFKI